MLNIIGQWIIDFIATTGYAGVFVLMTVESALIPLPSEITMPFSGFLVTSGRFNFWIIVFMGATGNLLGSLLAYAFGYWASENFIQKFIKKWGKWLLISQKEFNRSLKWLHQYGLSVAFFSRLLPGIRTIISLPCGLAKVSLLPFSILTFIGSFIWSAILTYFGVILGKNWTILGSYFHKFDALIILAIIIAVILYVYRHLKSSD